VTVVKQSAARHAPIARSDEEIYVTNRATADIFAANLLLCDPLTRLVAYPSFECHMVDALPRHAPQGMHLAIGDVDDLKAYVSQINETDASHFGHLAGNECMARIGHITRSWSEERLNAWPFSVCATFGGDEVIVAASGRHFQEFVDEVSVLVTAVQHGAPRPMSFTVATLAPSSVTLSSAYSVYRGFIAKVDAGLFACKADLRSKSISPRGEFVNLGVLSTDFPSRHFGATCD
jgi:GGDEF domain-containing protein